MEWKTFSESLYKKLGIQDDINHILFLVGINELGKGYSESYTKEEKVELIKLAKGRIMTMAGYYQQTGVDNEGWPTFSTTEEIITDENQALKKGIIEYFKNDL